MNAFLSKVPGCWASIVSTLAALACPARSSAGGSAASWASFAFDAAGGGARFGAPTPRPALVTWVNAGSPAGRTPGGGTGGASNLSGDDAAGVMTAAGVGATGAAGGAAFG